MVEVLKDYGYSTGAWGKWHNTPEEQITNKGPFDYWPTGYGFEYFYGFLAGEASQYEPTLTRNTTEVTEEKPKGYHLTEDIAQDAIKWLREQKAYAPEKPFFMYWAPGAAHGPHQVMQQWADKYKGKFDDGWDKYRERTFARAKAQGWIPQERTADRAPGVDGFVGLDPGGGEAVSAPPDGSVRGICRARRLQRGPSHATSAIPSRDRHRPTIYELTKITPPRVVNGFEQDPIAGVSMVYTFADAKAEGPENDAVLRHHGQPRHTMTTGSRARRSARAVGRGNASIKEWSPLTDKWELYDIDKTGARRTTSPRRIRQKLEEMNALHRGIEEGQNMPIGGLVDGDVPSGRCAGTNGHWWLFDAPITRMPESAAPKLGKNSSLVTMDVDVPPDANGVLYALAGFSGGVTCYVKDGFLNYEFNLFEYSAPGSARQQISRSARRRSKSSRSSRTGSAGRWTLRSK